MFGLSSMFLGQEILRQNETVSEPSGMLLHVSGMHCLEASGKVIPFSPFSSKLLRRLISTTVTENLFSIDVDGVSASYVAAANTGKNRERFWEKCR